MLNQDCQNYTSMFQDYRDGTLNPALQEALTQHLRSCSKCRELLREFEQITDLLRAEPEVDVPTAVIPDVTEIIASARNRNRSKHRQWVSVAAVLLVFAGSALVMNQGGIDTQQAKDEHLSHTSGIKEAEGEEPDYGASSVGELPPEQQSDGDGYTDTQETVDALRYVECETEKGPDAFDRALQDPIFNDWLTENDLGYGYELVECIPEEDGSATFVIYFYEDERRTLRYDASDPGWLSYSNVRSFNWSENEL
ncbi:MAG: zf-HC2 domain-containing protein [Bacillota bacterium]|jgi:hypothetical protein|nr:zf-HC2 domain-containing protein [Eubacteriales bacterium]MDI9491337.1 zf-HC2 domain-containing protein [Bacillota bacterium]NLV69382.1 hypothetical protein [Clostridiales bacterium]HPF18769.1 zf-HC2 domain-containing protein [Bacillota bacterium]